MPHLTNDAGRSFRVLELSLSANLKDLAQTLYEFDDLGERMEKALVACRIIAERFPAFTSEEVMWLLWTHIDRLGYQALEEVLCDTTDEYEQKLDAVRQDVHILVTDLARSKNDANYWQVKYAEIKGNSQRLIRDIPATKTYLKDPCQLKLFKDL